MLSVKIRISQKFKLMELKIAEPAMGVLITMIIMVAAVAFPATNAMKADQAAIRTMITGCEILAIANSMERLQCKKVFPIAATVIP